MSITRAEFDKAYQAIRLNDKDFNSKYIVVLFYLEQHLLSNARPYLGQIINELNQAQDLALFEALKSEMTRRHDPKRGGYGAATEIRNEDLSHLISLLQKLYKNGIKAAEAWILKTGDHHSVLLKWIDRYHEAYDKLANMFFQGGFNVPKDLDYALICFKKSYELNRQVNTANMIGRIYYEQQKYDDALDYFKKASDGGNQYGSFNAGLIYHSGLGKTSKNLPEAERLYKQAIQRVPHSQEFPGAHYQLARVYQSLHENEKGQTNRSYGKSNLELSKENYKIASDSKEGHALAAFELAKLYQAEKNYNNAEIYFKKAEVKGHAESQIMLWDLYKALNRPEAGVYLDKCASAGNAQALYERGFQHELKEEYEFAFLNFYKANQKGLALAKEKLTDKKTRLSGYFSLCELLKEEKDTFETAFKAMQPYLTLQQNMGYYFLNAEFLLEALDRTIDSDVGEAPFQKLEFLGDGVLTTAIREYFVDEAPEDWRVGDFEYATQSLLANKIVLPEIAKKLKLAELIELDETEGSHTVTDKMQADALEALIGAIFQDYGDSEIADSTSYYMRAREVVHNLWKPWLEKALQEKPRSMAIQKEKMPVLATAVASQPPSIPATQKKNGVRSLSPATQRVFCATHRNVTADEFSIAVPKMSNVNNRNVGKNGDTVLMTLLRNKQLRPEHEVLKIKTLLHYRASWNAPNNKGETADGLLKEMHPEMLLAFFK